jgi:hypothetical protein
MSHDTDQTLDPSSDLDWETWLAQAPASDFSERATASALAGVQRVAGAVVDPAPVTAAIPAVDAKGRLFCSRDSFRVGLAALCLGACVGGLLLYADGKHVGQGAPVEREQASEAAPAPADTAVASTVEPAPSGDAPKLSFSLSRRSAPTETEHGAGKALPAEAEQSVDEAPGEPRNQAGGPLGRYVRRVVRSQFNSGARACYERLLKRQPAAEGTVVLGVVIVRGAEGGGRVDEVTVRESSTLQDAELRDCMQAAMRSVHFRPPSGRDEPSELRFPFDFTYPVVLSPR